jgi:hypothetical protein
MLPYSITSNRHRAGPLHFLSVLDWHLHQKYIQQLQWPHDLSLLKPRYPITLTSCISNKIVITRFVITQLDTDRGQDTEVELRLAFTRAYFQSDLNMRWEDWPKVNSCRPHHYFHKRVPGSPSNTFLHLRNKCSTLFLFSCLLHAGRSCNQRQSFSGGSEKHSEVYMSEYQQLVQESDTKYRSVEEGKKKMGGKAGLLFKSIGIIEQLNHTIRARASL